MNQYFGKESIWLFRFDKRVHPEVVDELGDFEELEILVPAEFEVDRLTG